MNFKDNWLSLLQFVFSLLAASGMLMLSFGIGLLGGVSWLINLPTGLTMEDATLFTGMISTGFSGLLIFPSAFLALQRLRGKAAPVLPERLKTLSSISLLLLLVLILPAALVIGWLASRSATGTALVLPFMHVLAISIPMLWLVVIALHGLPMGSMQRTWGIFGAGLVLGPLIIITLELAAFLLFSITAVAIIGMDPERVAQLEELISAMRYAVTPEEVVALITPVLAHPGVTATILLFMAVVVPIIEESFKPIGLYLLLGRKISAVEGFTAGLLSGAGFGLFESLMLTSAGGSWLPVVVARAGTGAVHMLTAGLTGYGLASALSGRHYLRLLGCFAAALFIHGLWNGLAVVVTGMDMLQANDSLALSMQWIPVVSPLILVVLAIVCFGLLVYFNHRFKQTLVPESNK